MPAQPFGTHCVVTVVPEVLRSPTPRNREMSTHTALPLGHGEEPRGPAEHTSGSPWGWAYKVWSYLELPKCWRLPASRLHNAVAQLRDDQGMRRPQQMTGLLPAAVTRSIQPTRQQQNYKVSPLIASRREGKTLVTCICTIHSQNTGLPASSHTTKFLLEQQLHLTNVTLTTVKQPNSLACQGANVVGHLTLH